MTDVAAPERRTTKREQPSSREGDYHHGDLRRALIVAATKLLETDGARLLSLRSVARAAGVSHTAPYRHFRDKHELLEAVAAAGFDRLTERHDEILAEHPGDPRRQILEGCRAYLEEVLARPGRAHLMFGGLLDPERRSPELREAVERSAERLVRIVRHGEEAGLFRHSLPTRDLVLSIWSTTHGLAMLAAAGQLGELDRDGDPRKLVRRLVGHLLDGVAR